MKLITKIIMWIVIIIIVTILANVFINQEIFLTKYEIVSNKIKGNVKLVHITDVHSIRSDEQKSKIISKVKEASPDVIFITGDLIDTSYYNEEINKNKEDENYVVEEKTLSFLKELKTLAKVYFVYGNHEMSLLDDPENNKLKLAIEEIGIIILNNKKEVIKINDNEINLLGLKDPSLFYKDKEYAHLSTHQAKIESILDELLSSFENDNYTILLSHRPEYFDVYSKYDIDLAFTGHTHGGIAYIPFVGGVYAHPQGFFPKYSAGLYENDTLKMILSRGIGYARVPVRIFNPPEVVEVILKEGD